MAQQQQQTNYTPWILAGFGLLAWNKLFGKDPEDKKEEVIENKFLGQKNEYNPLSPSTYSLKDDAKNRGFKVTPGMTVSMGIDLDKVKAIAKQINGAIGIIYNDKSTLQGAFKEIPTRYAVWGVAKWYNTIYKRDLLFDLKDSTKAQATAIYDYIDKLPVAKLVKKK